MPVSLALGGKGLGAVWGELAHDLCSPGMLRRQPYNFARELAHPLIDHLVLLRLERSADLESAQSSCRR